MKKNLYKKIFSSILSVLLLTSFGNVFVQTVSAADPYEYKFLVALPGVQETSKLGEYIPAVITLTIGIAAVLAFIMITFGGVRYATSDAITGKEEGKKHIEEALWGLVLVIGAYAILNTLNPNLLKFNFNLKPGTSAIPTVPLPPVSPPGPPTATSSCVNDPSLCVVRNGVLQGYVLTAEQVAENNRIRDSLFNNSPNSILVNNGPCTTGGTTGCTNVVGLPQSAINNIKNLSSTSNCNCALIITGGTEGGHAEHRPGVAVYDLAPSSQLNTYLGSPSPVNGTTKVVNGVRYTYETTGANGRSTGNHWHAEPA